MELQNGIMLETAEGEKIGESLTAAKQGIGMVTASRIAMAAPGKRIGICATVIVIIFTFQEW